MACANFVYACHPECLLRIKWRPVAFMARSYLFRQRWAHLTLLTVPLLCPAREDCCLLSLVGIVSFFAKIKEVNAEGLSCYLQYFTYLDAS